LTSIRPPSRTCLWCGDPIFIIYFEEKNFCNTRCNKRYISFSKRLGGINPPIHSFQTKALQTLVAKPKIQAFLFQLIMRKPAKTLNAELLKFCRELVIQN